MDSKITWGMWMTGSTPFKGQAHAAMDEAIFRNLMTGLIQVMGGDFNRALDRLKQIMLAELDRKVVARTAETERNGHG